MPHVARDIPLRMSSGREKTAPSATVKGEQAVPAIVGVGVVRNSGDTNIARRRRRPCSRSGRRRGRMIGGRSGGGGMVLSWRAGGRETGGAALGAAGVGSIGAAEAAMASSAVAKTATGGAALAEEGAPECVMPSKRARDASAAEWYATGEEGGCRDRPHGRVDQSRGVDTGVWGLAVRHGGPDVEMSALSWGASEGDGREGLTGAWGASCDSFSFRSRSFLFFFFRAPDCGAIATSQIPRKIERSRGRRSRENVRETEKNRTTDARCREKKKSRSSALGLVQAADRGGALWKRRQTIWSVGSGVERIPISSPNGEAASHSTTWPAMLADWRIGHHRLVERRLLRVHGLRMLPQPRRDLLQTVTCEGTLAGAKKKTGKRIATQATKRRRRSRREIWGWPDPTTQTQRTRRTQESQKSSPLYAANMNDPRPLPHLLDHTTKSFSSNNPPASAITLDHSGCVSTHTSSPAADSAQHRALPAGMHTSASLEDSKSPEIVIAWKELAKLESDFRSTMSTLAEVAQGKAMTDIDRANIRAVLECEAIEESIDLVELFIENSDLDIAFLQEKITTALKLVGVTDEFTARWVISQLEDVRGCKIEYWDGLLRVTYVSYTQGSFRDLFEPITTITRDIDGFRTHTNVPLPGSKSYMIPDILIRRVPAAVASCLRPFFIFECVYTNDVDFAGKARSYLADWKSIRAVVCIFIRVNKEWEAPPVRPKANSSWKVEYVAENSNRDRFGPVMAQGYSFGEINGITASIFYRDGSTETILMLLGYMMTMEAIQKFKSEHNNRTVTLDFDKFLKDLDARLGLDASIRYIQWLERHHMRSLDDDSDSDNELSSAGFDWDDVEALVREEDEERAKKRVKLENDEDVAV
ncbi:hypothetical protein GGX14DRAFT_397177 [Mycena pura]|uniref:Uncharacterized protein n=1 Tax=Mycena pura TaxID=153505 RepID=A0AAD6YEZ4_9AGAR|nr:hypothetical protein GGX14DRAFT_397177 [Mycena pura]